MRTLSRPLTLLVLWVAGTLALLTACTSSPSTTPEQTATAPASTSPPSAAQSSTSQSSTSQSSTSPPSTTPSAAADALTLDITIADHQVSPNGDKINVRKGQTVVLNVTSDTDDEVHAHTAGDGYELEVKAGKPARGSFVAADTGTFEIESHHLEKIIAILVVR